MRRKKYPWRALKTVLFFSAASAAWASVPPPPVNQIIGIPDGVYANMTALQCRGCHEEPGASLPGYLADRHHLRVGMTIQSPTDVPYSYGTASGPGATYECLSCHRLIRDPTKIMIELEAWLEDPCVLCHKQYPGQATVHHRTPAAIAKDCKACHGPIDNPLDGHFIPTYQVSLTTPKTGGGIGGCGFCHLPGTDSSSGVAIQVLDYATAHHSTGIALPPYVNYYGNPACNLCHPRQVNDVKIRACETCHAMNSLHNIQTDSNRDGKIILGGEPSWQGHAGTGDDCWGCHGVAVSAISDAEQVANAVIPDIKKLSVVSMRAGTNTTITLSGSAFQNEYQGQTLSSNLRLTNQNTGLDVVLSSSRISEGSMTVGVPPYLPDGIYKARLVKARPTHDVRLHEFKYMQSSNAKNFVILPDARIDAAQCRDFGGAWKSVAITGNGFGSYSQGMGVPGTGIAVLGDGVACAVNNWSNIEIRASCREKCPANVTVDGMFGAVTAPVTTGSAGDALLASCAGCHGDKSALLSCDNPKWRLHARRNLVKPVLFDRAEKAYLGGPCAAAPENVKDGSRKR